MLLLLLLLLLYSCLLANEHLNYSKKNLCGYRMKKHMSLTSLARRENIAAGHRGSGSPDWSTWRRVGVPCWLAISRGPGRAYDEHVGGTDWEEGGDCGGGPYCGMNGPRSKDRHARNARYRPPQAFLVNIIVKSWICVSSVPCRAGHDGQDQWRIQKCRELFTHPYWGW